LNKITVIVTLILATYLYSSEPGSRRAFPANPSRTSEPAKDEPLHVQ